jgi:outer membrane protein OmpA-like peptidoglycan-associated protein
MIEIAGYASSTGTKALNQKLSDERAAAVAQYLRNTPMFLRGESWHLQAMGLSMQLRQTVISLGRDINRRVDVKVLVNKGLDQDI